METPSKKTKLIYWITTALLALFLIPSAFFANGESATQGMAHLGLPMWFNWELSIGKTLGGIILILPMLPKRLKEWAYVALGIDFISAAIAFFAVDGMGPGSLWFAPLIMFAVLVVSYIYFHKMYDKPGAPIV